MNIEQLKTIFETALKGLGVADPKVIFERPGELSHGDYATNVAMAYAKQLGKNPKALAEEIVAALSKSDLGMKKELLPFSSDPHVIADAPLSKLGETGARGWDEISKIEIAGPGFINISFGKKSYQQAIVEILDKKTRTENLTHSTVKKFSLNIQVQTFLNHSI